MFQEDIPTLSQGELLDYKYRFVGFLYLPHPHSGKKIQVTFFHQQSEFQSYIICMSDIPERKERRYAKINREKLGIVVKDREVVPYARRGIHGASYTHFKESIRQGFKQHAEWWEGEIL